MARATQSCRIRTTTTLPFRLQRRMPFSSGKSQLSNLYSPALAAYQPRRVEPSTTNILQSRHLHVPRLPALRTPLLLPLRPPSLPTTSIPPLKLPIPNPSPRRHRRLLRLRRRRSAHHPALSLHAHNRVRHEPTRPRTSSHQRKTALLLHCRVCIFRPLRLRRLSHRHRSHRQ